MDQPDSLLTAAKKVAQLTNMKWADVQRVYQALQNSQPVILPKSRGRLVSPAVARYLAAILLGVSGSPDPDQAIDTYKLFEGCRFYWPEQRKRSSSARYFTRFSEFLIMLLLDKGQAEQVSEIELRLDGPSAIVRWKAARHPFAKVLSGVSVDPAKIKMPASDNVPFTADFSSKQPSASIHFRGVIDGRLLLRLAADIALEKDNSLGPVLVSWAEERD